MDFCVNKMFRSLICMTLALLPVLAQESPPTYICGRTSEAPVIDGKGNETIWQQARELSPLRDIEGAAIPHNCRIKMLWDDACLYILADMDEPHLRASLKEHDSVIFHDPDFEVFIDPDGDGLNYIELEINALNTTWDLFIPRPYRFNDPNILHDWEIPGLKHAVHLRGTLNQATDTDQGWSVELAIPWSSITSHAHQPRTSIAPLPGTSMRMNFSRVNWQVIPTENGYQKLPLPESNHVWAPTGKINIHLPEHWGRVIFSPRNAGEWESTPAAPEDPTRINLYKILNEQLEHRNKTGQFNHGTDTPPGVHISFPAEDFFVLTTTCPRSGIRMRLDSEGRFAASPPTRKRPELYLWVHGNSEHSRTKWQKLFASYAQAGIDTVIIDGASARIAELTPLAKAAGLRVFAWMWALNRPGDSTALQHPDWYAVNALGKSCHQPQNRPFVPYYQFLCPNNENVQTYLLEQIKELAAIPGLAGIQVDYMRLPDVELPRGLWKKYNLDMSQINPAFDYCYCDKCKNAYAAQGETDWKDFRLQSTANLFNTLAAEIRSHGLIAACAVFPTPELASRMVHQDWSRFQADLVLPMVYHSFYNESADWAAEMTATGIQQSQNRLPVAPGVHIPYIEAASLPAQLESLCTAGASGIGIFSSDELTPEHLKSIQSWLSEEHMPR